MPRPAGTMGPDAAKIMARLGTSIQQGRRTTVDRTAQRAIKVQRSSIGRAVGSDMFLSGVGKRGAKVGARYKLEGGVGNPSAFMKAVGPLHLVERDTSPHIITSRYGAGTRRRRTDRLGGIISNQFGPSEIGIGPILPGQTGGGRRASILTPDGWRKYARHPGTKGKGPWAKGRIKAEPIIRASMRKQTLDIVRNAAAA